MTYYPANYHTHSLYCDGKSTLEEQVRAAEKCGLRQLGFSSHAPVPFENTFAMEEAKLPDYIREIDELQRTTDVTLLKSLECDYIPEVTTDFAERQDKNGLDYLIGGVHAPNRRSTTTVCATSSTTTSRCP